MLDAILLDILGQSRLIRFLAATWPASPLLGTALDRRPNRFEKGIQLGSTGIDILVEPTGGSDQLFARTIASADIFRYRIQEIGRGCPQLLCGL